MATLLFDKVDFKAKKLLEKKTLHNDKIINLPGRRNDPKYECTKNKASKYMHQHW